MLSTSSGGSAADAHSPLAALLEPLLGLTGDVVVVVDDHGVPTYVSSTVTSVLGHTPDEFLVQRWSLVHPDDVEPVQRLASSLYGAPDAAARVRVRLKDAAGRWRRLEMRAANLDDSPVFHGTVFLFREASTGERAVAPGDGAVPSPPALEHADPAVLAERLHFFLRRVDRDGGVVSVFVAAVDQFDGVTAAVGLAAGESLLAQLAARLRAVLRPSDVVARLPGNHLCVLCDRLSGHGEVEEVAGAIVEHLRSPIEVDGHEVFVTLSLGATVAVAADARPADVVLRDATAAMHRAIGRGPDRIEIHDESASAVAATRFETEKALRQALVRGELRVLYQPLYDLASQCLYGVEALLRWARDGELVDARDFIDVAEDTGIITSIGAWAIEESCALAARLAEAAPPGEDPLPVAFNLAARQLDSGLGPLAVAAAARRAGIEPRQLVVEITERVMVRDMTAASRALEELRRVGARVAVDDFGSGYASLDYLRSFPVDTVKIDGSFIQALGTDPRAEVIVRSVVDLGHRLGLTVVAEGVENAMQLELLRDIGADAAQGYFLGRPMEGEEVEKLVAGTGSAAGGQ